MRCSEKTYALGWITSEAFGHEQFNLLADQFVAAIPEQLFDVSVDQDDAPVSVHQ